jgi:hypothetical protein
MESRLQIPDEDQEPLAKFLALPATEANAFISALGEVRPSFKRQELVRAVQGKTSLPDEDSAAIVRVLLSLFVVGQDLPLDLDGLTEQVVLAAKESEHPQLKLDADGRETLKDRLRRALSQKAVGFTAKALSVAIEHKYLLHQARIMTDMRPVFTGSASDPPAAFVVSHVLRLTCHVDSGFEEFYMAASSEDLARIAEVVKRAQNKEASLREAMKACNIPVLAIEGDVAP